MNSFYPPDAEKLKYVIPAVARIPSGRNVAVWERLLSALAAAAFIRAASRSNSAWRIPIFFVGAELIRRAVTGHSFLYSSIGVSTAGHSHQHLSKSYAEQMTGDFAATPYDVKRTVTIGRPRTEVFAYVQTLENVFGNVPEIKNFRQRPDAIDFVFAPGTGSAYELHFDLYIVERDRHVAWHCEMDGQETAQGFLVFADAPGDRGTELTVALWHSRSVSSNLGAALSALVNSMDRALRKYLRAAKQAIETGHVTSAERLPAIHETPRRMPPGSELVNPQTTRSSVH